MKNKLKHNIYNDSGHTQCIKVLIYLNCGMLIREITAVVEKTKFGLEKKEHFHTLQ